MIGYLTIFSEMFGNQFGRHLNVECGLVCILPKEEWETERTAPVPLTSVSLLASVVHAVGQIELTQIYVNKEKQPIEAIYYFPVDPSGAVTHFHAELEGRTIKVYTQLYLRTLIAFLHYWGIMWLDNKLTLVFFFV